MHRRDRKTWARGREGDLPRVVRAGLAIRVARLIGGSRGVLSVVLGSVLLASPGYAAAPGGAQETIVFMRHGEKPAQGLGQLDCQGLNRSLALPRALLAKFGRPDEIFAPDPGHQMVDNGVAYNYIRPLATIEPTAIHLGMPVNTQFGAEQIDALQQALLTPANAHALIFVAWEHTLLTMLVRHLIALGGGDPASVPAWPGSEFDSLFVVRIAQLDGKVSAVFARDAEGLNNQPTTCPMPHA